MKKTLLLTFLFSLFYAPISFGQIQRKILGLELGVTTKQDAINILTQKGFKINQEYEYFIINGPISFGGNEWDGIMVNFQGEKLLSIFFMDGAKNKFNEQSILVNSWETLKLKLKRKYSEYFYKEDVEKNLQFFSDENTEIMLSYSTTPLLLALCYVDKTLQESKSNEEDEEL